MKTPDDDRPSAEPVGAAKVEPQMTEDEAKREAWLRSRAGKRALKRDAAARSRKASKRQARAHRLATHAAWNDPEHRAERDALAAVTVRDLRSAGLSEREAQQRTKRALSGVRP